MPPAVTKELRVVYGAQTIGGTSDWELDRGLIIDRGYERTRVEFDAVYSGAATQNAFAVAAAAFETAMRVPRQRLQVLATDGVGADTILDLDPATGPNTGFNADARAAKRGSPEDTLRSRRYHCTIVVEEPADLAGQNGLRSSRIEVALGRGRVRLVTISGVYTALGANSARAQYNAQIAGYVAARLAELPGTYSTVPDQERATADDANKILEFSRSYRAIIQAESGAGTDDVQIIEPTLRITQRIEEPHVAQFEPDGTRARRLAEIDVSYSAGFDAALALDMQAKWEGDIRPRILSRMDDLFGTGELAVVEERAGPDPDEESIWSATLRVRAPRGNLIEIEEIETSRFDRGKKVVRTWGPLSTSGHVFSGVVVTRLDVITTILELESGARGSDLVEGRESETVIWLTREIAREQYRIGIEGESIELRRTRVADSYELVTQIEERPPTSEAETAESNETQPGLRPTPQDVF